MHRDVTDENPALLPPPHSYISQPQKPKELDTVIAFGLSHHGDGSGCAIASKNAWF
jgi:hypothetical protein